MAPSRGEEEIQVMLTIAYMTCRKEPRFDWFRDSLLHQNPIGIVDRVVVVDFYADTRKPKFDVPGIKTIVVPPKPTVWQGPYRLTKQDYFAAANARNTALCYSEDGWIAYVDDLSVLMPDWLQRVTTAMSQGYIACGAYRKVLELAVNNGEVKQFKDHPAGHDHRWEHGKDSEAISCNANWFFGCSLVAPIDAFLKINGWPEAFDGMGYEDCFTGMAISKHGYSLKYDRSMMTYESEEAHGDGPNMLRIDKGKSPNDKSHAALRMFENSSRFDNWFGSEGIAGLRQRILRGEPFPIVLEPRHDWYDGQPLSEL